MPTVVYQGLQSCFESQLIETTTLKLKVAVPSCIELSRGLSMVGNGEIKEKWCYQDINKKSLHVGDNNMSPNLDSNKGLSFLQSLSNISSKDQGNEKQQQSSYVHPLSKKSPRLSQKSLELCTENLGSETGSDTMESSILSSSSFNSISIPTSGKSSSSIEDEDEEQQERIPRQMESRRKVISRNFPPPLTTIRSSNSLQVRPHREDGRLIIKAIETPSRNTYLQAERSNGRLRLSFFNDCVPDLDSEIINEENEGDIDEDGTINEFENDLSDEDNNYQDQDEYDTSMSKAVDEINMEGEVDIGMETFQRPSRCNESGHGNKGLCNWKPLWVATS